MRRSDGLRPRTAAGLGLAAFTIAFLPALASAQIFRDRGDAGIDADDARTEALLGTLNLATPAPDASLYATAPGAEQQATRPRLRLNVLAPLSFTSNAEDANFGGSPSWATFPFAAVSGAAPVGELPLRVSAQGSYEARRFFSASDASVDRLTFSGRLQYVDPANDQAFSPYFAITPRFSYLPTLSDRTEARQDFNLGFNRRFNFDGALQPIAPEEDTSKQTVWSFGVTAFAQRRLREPQRSSDALFLIPSAAWVISVDWNASFAVEMLGRWFDADPAGTTRRDWDVTPIVTLEYILPAWLFSEQRLARFIGRPAIDFQLSRQIVSSTASSASFTQWEASATLKAGWRF